MATVHPRLRGELVDSTVAVVDYLGSSPLTRGTPIADRYGLNVQRFIPAYAGNSNTKTFFIGCSPVHPRLRGELGAAAFRSSGGSGSSPLTRGTRNLVRLSVLGCRFIPAYAGNSLKDGINPSIHTLGI